MSSHTQASSSFMTAGPSSSSNSSSALISFNVAAQAPLKLTGVNCISWRLQCTTLLTGYDFLGYVDGSYPFPAPTITENSVTTTNPAHHHWVCQDQLLLNAIIGSLSPHLIPFIATARTALDAWQTLATTYGKPTRGRITQLKTQLNQLTKGSTSITNFMQSVKLKVDELALMHVPVDTEDITIKILQGLDDDYKELANAIQAREHPISFTKLHEKLLTREAQLLAVKTSPLPLSATANTATKSFASSRPRPPGFPSSDAFHSSPSWGPQPLHSQAQRPRRPYLGYCQLCSQQGHRLSVAPHSILFRMPPDFTWENVNFVTSQAILLNVVICSPPHLGLLLRFPDLLINHLPIFSGSCCCLLGCYYSLGLDPRLRCYTSYQPFSPYPL